MNLNENILQLDPQLPEYPAFEPGYRRAPRREANLTQADKELAIMNTLRYIPKEHHQQMAVEYGKAILSKVLSEKSALVQVAASTVFGLGTQVGVMLPYSRKHEYEADYMGIVFMEMAGYDSQASVDFWEKMSSSSGDSNVQELLSTHPSDENRVANLQSKIPEAKAIARSMR
jgi:predicted Zn-dependent protease